MDEKAFVDGRLVDAGQACIPYGDYGLSYGYGVFETIRITGGKPFMLKAHLERISASMKELRFPLKPTLNELMEGVDKIIQVNGRDDGYLKITVTYGSDTERLAFNPTKNTVFMETGPLPDYTKQVREGVSLTVSSVQRNPYNPSCGHKTLNYLDNVLAKQEAREKGFFDAILLDTKGRVSEASTANIFFLKDGVLTTPPLEAGCLPGITRGLVMDIASEAGMRVVEEHVHPKDFSHFSEAFITNTAFGLLPVAGIDETRFGDGHPGPAALALREAYFH